MDPLPGLPALWRSSFSYNNLLYELSGHIAELLDDEKNRTWENLIKDFYFDPLGMKNANFIHILSSFDDFAKPGIRSPNGTWDEFDLRISAKVQTAVAAAGAICVGSADFLSYLAFLLRQNSSTGDKISKDAIREAWQPSNYLPPQQQGVSYEMFKPMFKIDSTEPIYGMGWFVGIYRGAKWTKFP